MQSESAALWIMCSRKTRDVPGIFAQVPRTAFLIPGGKRARLMMGGSRQVKQHTLTHSPPLRLHPRQRRSLLFAQSDSTVRSMILLRGRALIKKSFSINVRGAI